MWELQRLTTYEKHTSSMTANVRTYPSKGAITKEIILCWFKYAPGLSIFQTSEISPSLFPEISSSTCLV